MALAKTADWVDAQEMARRRPETFSAPDADEILGLRPGCSVKICNGRERFWVTLTSAAADAARPFGSAFRGTVDNDLADGAAYGYGDLVEFEGRRVYTC